MRKLLPGLALGALLVGFGVGPAFAQSSGNFTAAISTPQCTIDNSSGALGGGSPGGTLLTTTIKTSSGSGTTLLITPSLDTGLYTNTLVDPNMSSSTQTAGVVVTVTMDGQPVLPETGTDPFVIYDKRFQELSTGIFAEIATCQGPMPSANCNIETVLSTLSAHSFNFVAPNLTQGSHTISVGWQFQCFGNNGAPESCDTTVFQPNTAGACVGPGTVTVTQTKVFSTSTGVTM